MNKKQKSKFTQTEWIVQITFDDNDGITLEGDEDAVRKAYEIWNPYNAERLKSTPSLEAIIAKIEAEKINNSMEYPRYYPCGFNTALDKAISIIREEGGGFDAENQ